MKNESKINLYPFCYIRNFFFCFQMALACSCIRDSITPCNTPSTTIFTGEVTNINIVPDVEKQVQFKVIETFENVKTQTLTITTGFNDGDCGYNFKLGEKYLVYASGSEVNLCSRTRPLSRAVNDVEILRQTKSSDKAFTSRLFGTALIRNGNDYTSPTQLKIRIIARNEKGKIYQTVSDEAGNYRFIDLPNGKYKLQALYKKDYDEESDIIIDSGGEGKCVENSFLFDSGGKIRGRVIDSEGKPVAGIIIDAEGLNPLPEDEKYKRRLYDITDEKGNYEIKSLPLGKYHLSINYKTPIREKFPFPPTFYLKRNNSAQAQTINVKAEEMMNGFNFRLPPKLKPRVITGQVLFADGKPVTNARVEAKEIRTNKDMGLAELDNEGRFNLKVFEGQSYSFYIYDFSTHRDSSELKRIHITQKGQIESLKLVVPIPQNR